MIVQITFCMRNWSKLLSFFQVSYEILLEDFNPKVGREVIFKPTTGNESFHQVGNVMIMVLE